MVRCSSCADSFNVWKASRSECGNPSRITSTRWAKRSHGFMILESAPSRTGRSPANGTSCRGMQLTKWLFIRMMITVSDQCILQLNSCTAYIVWCLQPSSSFKNSFQPALLHRCRYWTSPLGFWGPGVHLWWAVLGKFWGHHHVSRVAWPGLCLGWPGGVWASQTNQS